VILRGNVPLICVSKNLWDNYYKIDSENFYEKALRLPFKFELPENLPPSFKTGSSDNHIHYTLEVTVERDGFFNINKRIEEVLSITSRATRQEMAQISELRQGWEDSWAVISKNEWIRKYFWHYKSRAEVHVCCVFRHSFIVLTTSLALATGSA
jgi:hypothetical protein